MRRGGFTLIEVMMALAVLTIATGALISTQTLTARSNVHAREVTIATEIAQTWAERLKLDAMSWTNVTDFANTVWLRDSTVGMNQWMNPQAAQVNAAPVPSRTFAYDRYGRDIPLGVAGLHYCVGYRFNWVALAGASQPPAMRVDIRVFWPREGTGTEASCDLPAGLDPNFFHTVALPIVVRRTEVQGP